MSQTEVEVLVSSLEDPVREIVERLGDKLARLLPDAAEEPDTTARLIGYTYQPGTYKGLIVAVAPQAAHVNLMFSKGVELLETDTAGLLEGTGKKARHIKFYDPASVDLPQVDTLVEEAARRTPR